MTYEYLDTVTGETLTIQQRITDEPFTGYDPKSGRWYRPCTQDEWENLGYRNQKAGDEFRVARGVHPVKRQISAESGGFRLVRGDSGGWGADGYSKKPHEREAEAVLGRRLTKAGG